MLHLNANLSRSVQTYLHSQEFNKRNSLFPEDVFEKILRYGEPLGSHIETHSSLPRCMDRLKELIENSRQEGITLPSGTVVIAEQLKQGCGRFDREWHAPEGGFWMAVAWADTLLPEFAALLPLAAGIASCETLRSFGVNAHVKWVNDVHVQGRKIAGVLCETTAGHKPDDRYHLIGIGINCNNKEFPPELHKTATSLGKELNKKIDVESFSVQLLANLALYFGLVHLGEERFLGWQRDGEKGIFTNPIVEEWKRYSDSLGRKVMYGYDVVKKPLYEAVPKEIDPYGGLVMQLENGSVITENSGEILYLAN